MKTYNVTECARIADVERKKIYDDLKSGTIRKTNISGSPRFAREHICEYLNISVEEFEALENKG
jgi:hypothetical protein